MKKELFIKRYCKAIEAGRAAIFAGAGLSVPAGFVNWKDLLREVADELGLEMNANMNLVDLAQYYVNSTHNDTQLSQTILNEFTKATNITVNHKILASLPINIYWTTNYDKLIETALEDEGKIVDVKSLPSNLAISKDYSNAIVYKMHGDVNNPDQTILTRDQFENYDETHKAFLESFGYDLTNKTFLFLGLSFDDPNLKKVLRHTRMLHKNNQRRHYYILKKSDGNENEKRSQQLFIEDLKNYGIDTILIDDYTEITSILSEIKYQFFRKTIFISGAAAQYGRFKESEVKQFLRTLSAEIIKLGFRVVNGYGLGFGNEIVAGVTAALQELHKPIDGNFIIRPFPQGIDNINAAWDKHRRDMISKAGTTIFLFGNKKDPNDATNIIPSNGMRSEFEIAKEYNNFLIPVGATGFMAEELCNELISNKGDLASPSIEDLQKLNDKSSSLDDIFNVLMNILSTLQQ